MRPLFLIPALIAAPLLAQDEPAAAPDRNTAADTAWTALQKQYRDATSAFYKPWQEARAKGEAYQLDYATHPDRTFPARFEAFAGEWKGTPAAAQALAEIVRLGPDDDARGQALDTLLADHIGSKVLRGVAWSLQRFRDAARRDEALSVIVEKSPHAEVRGFALLVSAQIVKDRDPERALALLAEVREKYGEESYFGRGTLAKKADGEIFEIRQLAIGMQVPEIEGEDVDGVAFKLSDYRGKVVLIDFWGDW